MPPKRQKQAGSSICQVCKEIESKYRCSACPVRYCSVACYKLHKANECAGPATTAKDSTPALDIPETIPATQPEQPLKPLTDVSWPPEPDSNLFDDPLTRDDPKPLRREELMRIATSPDLRQLLTTTSLPQIILTLDSIHSPSLRAAALARLLGVDDESLSRASAQSIINDRDSPPPLEDLLRAFAGQSEESVSTGPAEEGYYLSAGSERRVWIGDEEKRVMRIWAKVVIGAIDGDEQGGDTWGKGDLEWAV